MTATRSRRRAPRTNEEWTEATIGELTRRARREFARQGYAQTSVDAIADAAKLTKGAVYYHFGDKRGLFEAALRDAQAEVVRRIDARANRARDPIGAVVDGCEAFLEIALDDELRQIALVDGPAVLGWSRWRAIDAEFGLGSLIEGVRACAVSSLHAGRDPEALSHLISGALNEAVFLVAEADDRDAAYQRVVKVMRATVRGMLRG